ncbi:hypothetical protein [Desulfofustis limnaeus]|jgi:hypothetical protein|uniref:Uncharacterized protein n=1 Tax=Desulfofustis limnaeus TaxID=2740163 RepID=A0ABM7W7V9_9BACT|nr:hypothetical protein [Desulfofustis limnaeus]MDX9896671.1 hypothetical protein [Desulfofustis sp.]BDD86986.1 hypothetical protein DPPLL_13510 [Desulfofustis limnaeus]
MSLQKKLQTRGILLLLSFFVVLAVIFSPVFPGKVNGLDYMDNLFNMISKGSSYFIPASKDESSKYVGTIIEATIKLANEAKAGQVAQLIGGGGAEVVVNGSELQVKGDMGAMLQRCLDDADLMFKNQGEMLQDKYGLSAQEVLHGWWVAFSALSKELTRQESFKEAKELANVQKRVIEPSYNYYGVEAQNWKENLWLIVAALAFYVVYTLWYGFGIMYIFEGLGMKIGH